MDVRVEHLDHLLEILSKKTGQDLDYHGFGEMSVMVEEGLEKRKETRKQKGRTVKISKGYLYENIFRKKEKARERGEETISLNVTKLDNISVFLGYNSFRDFVQQLENPIDKVLLACAGNYYSYVRRNGEKGVVLRSPVSITEIDGKIIFELLGPKWKYTGEVKLKHGCLFVLMKAAEGKMIHHVYKIGVREQPLVLQGIFSGVSTAFDPIGGRAVLIRSGEELKKLSNAALDIDELRKSDSNTDRTIAEYFEAYSRNNLIVSTVRMFNEEDLIEDSLAFRRKSS
jgi:hypothetical protein